MQNATGGIIQQETLAWTVGVSGCTAPATLLFVEATAGVDHAMTTIAAAAQGQPFTASFNATVPAVEMGVTFWAGEEFLDAVAGADPQLTGTVADSADAAIFYSCGGVEVSVDFVVGA